MILAWILKKAEILISENWGVFDLSRICLQYGRPGFDPGLGRSPAEGKGYPLQYSGLENSMDCIVHGVARRLTRLSDQLSLTHMLPEGLMLVSFHLTHGAKRDIPLKTNKGEKKRGGDKNKEPFCLQGQKMIAEANNSNRALKTW